MNYLEPQPQKSTSVNIKDLLVGISTNLLVLFYYEHNLPVVHSVLMEGDDWDIYEVMDGDNESMCEFIDECYAARNNGDTITIKTSDKSSFTFS